MSIKYQRKLIGGLLFVGGLFLSQSLLAEEQTAASDIQGLKPSAPAVQTASNLPSSLRSANVEESVNSEPPLAVSKSPLPSPKEMISYNVPCLTVHEDGSHGKLSYLPMTFTRTKDDKPLRVMITDDTPIGSGQTIHSSVWLAAVTAAMLRNDTMHGVTISVEFSGNVDGPSAGSVTCLAILSAMDGRKLPDDFAMTGTILPDGTIGVVGGVPGKMRAAAKAGKKKIFIPAFLRFEKDEKGKEVDLARLADELKVELHRVTNIAEAYAVLHNEPYADNPYVNVRDMTRLPQATEDVLLPVYRDLLAKIQEKLKKNPKLAQAVIVDDYILSPALAESLYQEGKLLPATLQIFRTWQAWQAWERSDLFMETFYKEKNPDWSKIKYLREYHLRRLILAMREALDKHGEKCVAKKIEANKKYIENPYKGKGELTGYFPFKDGQTEITAQLEPVEIEPVLTGKLQIMLNQRPDVAILSEASQKDLDYYWNIEMDILDRLHLVTLDESSLDNFIGKLADTLPQIKANKRAIEVEKLFYSAACAADSVAGDNFQSSVAAQQQADGNRKNVIDKEFSYNPILYPFLEVRKNAAYCHAILAPDAEKKPSSLDYHIQASIKNQVTLFSMASAALVMYGGDRSSDFIPHLIRNARAASIRNINECVRAGIPCFAAICDFETAEAARNSNQEMVYSLISYWRASLYSKALLMSFKNN